MEKKRLTDVNEKANESPKSGKVAWLLCLLFGMLGIHRFYVGKIGTGILMIITAGGIGIWGIIDLISITHNKFEDKQQRPLYFSHTMSQRKKNIVAATSVTIWIVLFVTALLSSVFYATSGLVNTVTQQLEALKAGNFEQAYSYNSKDFQKTTSLAQYKLFIEQNPSLKNNKSSWFNQRAIDNNLGYLSGTLTSTDGAQTPVQYILIKENGTWKIYELKVLSSGVETQVNE